MPERDGYELIASLRARWVTEGGEVPAIVVTGYVSMLEKSRALAAGFQAHVAKPISIEELLDKITALASPPKKNPES